MKHSLYTLIIRSLAISFCYAIFYTISFAAQHGIEGIQVYHKNMHLSEEHKQKLAADIDRYHNADNVWDELRHEFTLPHYEDNPQVQEQIRWFMNRPDFLVTSATRAAPYLYYILQQARKRHLPVELVLLPIMESSYNPFAYSPKGAAGIWQMMPGTASGFGIKQDWWYDGRRDVITSTRAALDYLTYLNNFFDGNWLLAIGAYDTGEGNILSAIRRNIRDGKNTDFWSLPIAQETRIYVPRLLALAIIISHPYEYPIKWPEVRNAPYLAQIDIGGQIDLKHAAEMAGLSLKKLMQFNPGHNRPTTDPNGPFKLVLPIQHVERFTENLARSPLREHIQIVHYKAKSGETVASIAKRFHISTYALRKANPSLIYHVNAGKELAIPKSKPTPSESILDTNSPQLASLDREQIKSAFHKRSFKKSFSRSESEVAVENSQGKYELQSGDTLYMARKGDDLKKIAKKFRLNLKTLAVVNHISSSKRIHAGEKLIIPTHYAKEEHSSSYQLENGDTVYKVRHGDNVEKIAQKFNTSPAAIRLANLLTDNTLQEGDQLVIPTHKG